MEKQLIYLNNAATSWPKAPGVVDAVIDSLHKPPQSPYRGSTNGPATLEKCRDQLATLLAIDHPQRIIITPGSTFALNQAIYGLQLSRNDHIISSVFEHNSVIRPLHRIVKEQQCQLSIIGLNEHGRFDMSAYGEALKQSPTLVVLNHVSNVTGQVLDVARLFSMAKSAGAITLLDASQSVGHLTVHPIELQADMVAFPGHKGLHGPPGIGVLYVSPNLTLRPLTVGGTGVRSDKLDQPSDMPMWLESGTHNITAVAGLIAALQWYQTHGHSHVKHAQFLTEQLREELHQMSGLTIFSGDTDSHQISIVSFQLNGWTVHDVGYILEQSYHICCRSGLHCAPWIHKAIGSAPQGTVRISISGFNTISEIEQVITAIKQLSA